MIFQRKPKNQELPKSADARIPECPNCGDHLGKIPSAKTQCPACGKYMYVRTDPTDLAKKVVTKKQADDIDIRWSKQNRTFEVLDIENRRAANTQRKLQEQFKGKMPSENDVKWMMLLEDSIQNVREENWGFYRNTLFQMAELLRKEKKYGHALHIYF